MPSALGHLALDLDVDSEIAEAVQEASWSDVRYHAARSTDYRVRDTRRLSPVRTGVAIRVLAGLTSHINLRAPGTIEGPTSVPYRSTTVLLFHTDIGPQTFGLN